MTAIETLKAELTKIQQQQAQCMSDFGTVKNDFRYDFQILTEKAKEFHDAIEILNVIYDKLPNESLDAIVSHDYPSSGNPDDLEK